MPAAFIPIISLTQATWQEWWRSAAWCTGCRSVFLLAAAWSRVLAPAEIAAEIGRDLGFLQTDMAGRSHPPAQSPYRVPAHVEPVERRRAPGVYAPVGVPRRGDRRGRPAGDRRNRWLYLAELIDMALLRRLPNGRYEIHELLRQFAAEQLAGRHKRRWASGGATAAQPLLSQPACGTGTAAASVAAAWQLSMRSKPILRTSALRGVGPCSSTSSTCSPRQCMRSFSTAKHGETSVRRSAVCRCRGRVGRLVAQQVSMASRDCRALHGQVCVRLGACEVHLSNFEFGEQLLLNGLQTQRAAARTRALRWCTWGWPHAERGELPLSRTRLQDSLALSRANDDHAGIARALLYLLQGQSDYAQADSICSESLAHARKVRAARPDCPRADLPGFL